MQLSPQSIVITIVAAIGMTALFASSIDDGSEASASTPVLGGKIVFDSNRAGVRDVWVMDIDGSNQENLTLDQAEPTYFPRWSPDGTKIAYEVHVVEGPNDEYDIWVMNADGSGKTGIAQEPTLEGGPTWSPDGTKITFYDGDNVWVMNADGTNRVQLTNNAEFSCCAEWHPDGTKMLFDAIRNGDRQIWSMNVDGSSEAIQPGTLPNDLGVRYSPDGQMLAFYNFGDIFTMNANGSDRQQLTDEFQDDINEYSPTFTADGAHILFVSDEEEEGVGQIFMMDLDGENRVNVSNSASSDSEPDVQPLIVRLWGDSDCDGEVSSRDNQALLRNVLSQAALSQTQPCPALGTEVQVDDTIRLWGDSDCDGEISSRDNQALLRNVLSQAALSQTEPCPDIGDDVEVLFL